MLVLAQKLLQLEMEKIKTKKTKNRLSTAQIDQIILKTIKKDGKHIDAWNSSSQDQLKFEMLLRTTVQSKDLIPLLSGINFSQVSLNDVSIDVVDGCNLRCIGCPNSTLKPSVNSIPADTVIDRVRNIDVGKIKRLRLYRYGEPLFNKELPEILVKLKTLNRPKIKEISLSTNAQHRNLSTLEKVLSTGMLDNLAISADGDGTKESFEFMRPPGKFDLLVNFVRSARSFINKNNLNTTISMGITLPHVRIEKMKYITSKKHEQAWKDAFGEYVDSFDFHKMLKMPGSLLDEVGAFNNLELYETPTGACSSVVERSVYVDGKGIVQPCCWAIDVSNLCDLNNEKFSESLLRRLAFKSMLDSNRQGSDICSDCAQTCYEKR
jgi:organic radical activating enzyme